jgi:hypothetical protein
MGRLSHLKRALPTWVQHTEAHIFVVDQECPDGSGAWAASAFPGRVTAVASKALRSPGGRLLFHKAAAQNAGARAARDRDMLAFLDADTIVTHGFGGAASVRRRDFLIADNHDRDLTGLLVVSPSSFFQAGGFDEGFTEYGSVDLSMRLQLYGRYPHFGVLPRHMARAIPHGNDLRTKNHSLSIDDANLQQFERIQRNALAAKIQRETFLTDREVARLLGFSMIQRQL